MTEPRATLQDMREMRWCVRGFLAWCDRYGFDSRQVAREGLALSQLEAIDDDYARQLAARIRER